MNQKLLALACLSLIALAACQPEPVEPAEPVEPTAAATAAPAPVELAPSAEALPSDAAPTFDQRAFSGTFRGTLPCASCPGIDTTLALNGDGSYQLTELYQDEAGPAAKMDGNWTVEADDRQIRLDPNSKSEQDRLYAIASNDEITQLGLDGKPAESDLNYSLKRGR